MKTILKTLAFLSLCFVFSPTWSANVAVFNAQQAIMESNTAKSRLKILRNSTHYKSKRARFERLQNEGKALIEKVKKDADVLSLAKRKEIQKQLKSKQQEMEKIADELKKAEIEASKKLISEMAPRLQRAAKQTAKAKKIDVLLERQMAVYVSDAVDITDEVIKRLNQ